MQTLAALTEILKDNDSSSNDYNASKHGRASIDYHTNSCYEKSRTNSVDYQTDSVKVKLPSRSQKKETDLEYEKLRQLCAYETAPHFLKFNQFIRHGYRKELPTWLCVESIFWWTNETVNIWSHLIGWILFVALTITDIQFLNQHASIVDKILLFSLLFCFQLCMVLSSVYHTFCCRSANDYACFLSYDLFGIAMALLVIYISGIYYAFWCHDSLRNFYVTTVAFIFIIAMVLQIPRLKVKDHVKMLVFVIWAAYGVVPTCHWYFEMGGNESQMVQLFIPRVIGMYALTGSAFLVYLLRVPERWFAGKFDYFGHSHNWWHFLVLIALYFWHNSGFAFLEYRLNHGCSAKTIY